MYGVAVVKGQTAVKTNSKTLQEPSHHNFDYGSALCLDHDRAVTKFARIGIYKCRAARELKRSGVGMRIMLLRGQEQSDLRHLLPTET